jgi:hypothetical protein
VITGLVVEGNKIKTAGRVAEVVNSIVATRDRILKRESDLVETAIGNAQAPNELEDIGDVLLVRFGSKDDGRAPRPKASPDPTVAF